jgi:hypothetical protein
VRPLQRDRSTLVKAGCAFVFGLFWTGFSLFWVTSAWMLGAPTLFVAFGVPFVLAGFAMLGWSVWTGLVRTVAVGHYFGPPEISLSEEPLRVGQAFRLSLRQPVRREVQFRRVVIQTLLRETAIYRRGTDSRTVHFDHIAEEYVSEGRRLYANDELAEQPSMRIPSDAMHSFTASRNRLEWFVRVKVDLPNLPDVWEELKFEVLPRLAEDNG